MTAALEEGRKLLNIARSARDAFLLLASAAGIRQAIVMFLAQQTVEKALKAVMFARGIEWAAYQALDPNNTIGTAALPICPASPTNLTSLAQSLSSA